MVNVWESLSLQISYTKAALVGVPGVLVLLKSKVLTPSQAHVCHKLTQDLLHRAPKQLQNLLSIPLSVHVNDLNFTAVDAGLHLLQHISINFIRIESRIF